MSVFERLRILLSRRSEVPIFVDNEVPSEAYLETLSEIDKKRVNGFVSHVKKNSHLFEGKEVAVIAFGSSVKPSTKRFGPVNDIDLRLVTSAFAESEQQTRLIEKAVTMTKIFALTEKIEFTFYPNTTSKRVVEYKLDNGKTEIGPYYIDYDNNDPSYVIQAPAGGLPLHVSISGRGGDVLKIHLDEERRQKQYFSILGLFSSLTPTEQ